MLSMDEVNHFNTFGYVVRKQVFSKGEMDVISTSFDAAMRVARGGAEEPEVLQDEQGYSRKRQQVVPFFDYASDVFYPLLDDDRIMGPFGQLLGGDFLFTLSEGIIHAGGTGWHTDAVAPEGMRTMRAALYLDELGSDDWCLSVVPGSHHAAFRESIRDTLASSDSQGNLLTGRLALSNNPGDVLFMNHKLFHTSLSDRPGRRAVHVNCTQNAGAVPGEEKFEWLEGFLAGETGNWGRFYSDKLIARATPRLLTMLQRAMVLGFGNTGPGGYFRWHRQPQFGILWPH